MQITTKRRTNRGSLIPEGQRAVNYPRPRTAIRFS